MDALRLYGAILRTLVFERPAIAIVLLVVILIGFVLGALGPVHGTSGFAILAVAVPAWGLLTAAALRLEGCCVSAGALGIPGHYPAARRTQYLLLALFAGVPSIYALLLSREPNASMYILLGSAIGVLLGRAFVLPGVIAAVWLTSRVQFDPWAFAGTLQGALLFLAVTIAGYLLWFRAPLQFHAHGVWSAAALADARHETLGVPGHETVAHAGTVDARPGNFGSAPTPGPQRPPVSGHAIESLLPAGVSLRPASFWGGLGHLPDAGWRLTAVFAAIGLGAFVIPHFYRHGRTDVGAFLAISLIAGAWAGCRSLRLEGAWATSAGEQSVLMLTPRWPSRPALKWLVISSLWNPVPEPFVAWLAVAVVGVSLGWLPWPLAAQGAAGLAATSVACFAFLPLFLAQKRIRKDNRLAQAYLVFVGFTGLIMLMLVKSPEGWALCCELLFGVALLPLLAFLLRRPQFPARPDDNVTF